MIDSCRSSSPRMPTSRCLRKRSAPLRSTGEVTLEGSPVQRRRKDRAVMCV